MVFIRSDHSTSPSGQASISTHATKSNLSRQPTIILFLAAEHEFSSKNVHNYVLCQLKILHLSAKPIWSGTRNKDLLRWPTP